MPVFYPRAQRLSVNKLSRNEMACVDLINLMDRNDVWMIEGGRSLGFLYKAAHAFRMRRDFSRKKFQGHFAIKFDVFRKIDFTHTTCADLSENAVMGERC